MIFCSWVMSVRLRPADGRGTVPARGENRAPPSGSASETNNVCQVKFELTHFMRNVLAHAGKHGRRVVAAFIATAFAQEDAEMARTQWRQVADQLRPKVAKLAILMDEAEADVLAL